MSRAGSIKLRDAKGLARIKREENAISSRYKALQLDSRVNIVSISLSFETSKGERQVGEGRKDDKGRGGGEDRGMRLESAKLHPRDALSSFRRGRSYRTFREIDERQKRSLVCQQ